MHINKISSILCFIVFLFIYGISSRADLQVSDEIAVFSSGVSLATRQSIDVDSLMWLQSNVNIGKIGPDGHLYTKYFPGNILGTAIIYRLTEKANDSHLVWNGYVNISEPHILANSEYGARMALRWNSLLGSMVIAIIFIFLLKRFDWKTAVITVLIFGLSTDWWYQSRGLFSEIGAGTFLLLCLYFADTEHPSLSAFSLGVSLLFRPTNLLGIPVWVYSVWKTGIRQVWSGIFIVLGLCGLLFYNWIRFETFFDFGYGDAKFTGKLIEGLVGVLFSPGRSLFFYSPILILSISGARMFYTKDKVLTGTLLTVIVCHIFSVAMWQDWDGGEAWGSRLITPILPLLGILTAPIIEKAFSPKPEKTRGVVLLLAFLGLAIQLLTLTANPFFALVNYLGAGQIPYWDTVISFQNSWLSLQIRNLEHWHVCNIDAYSLRQLFDQCK